MISMESQASAQDSYRPKADLHVTVTEAGTKEFLAIVESFAAENGFALQHNMSGLPLKDGRGIIYLAFSRSDGIEIRVANPFHAGDIIVDIYDKKEIGAWESLLSRFSEMIKDKFPSRQTEMD